MCNNNQEVKIDMDENRSKIIEHYDIVRNNIVNIQSIIRELKSIFIKMEDNDKQYKDNIV